MSSRENAPTLLGTAARSGALASVVSAAVLAICGHAARNDAAGPVNAPSQWLWGRYAARARYFSGKHTVVGYAIHHATSVFWALLFERMIRRKHTPANVVAASLATTAVAYAVDFKIVPKRISPGFQEQLAPRHLYLAYAGFALGLAAAGLLRRP